MIFIQAVHKVPNENYIDFSVEINQLYKTPTCMAHKTYYGQKNRLNASQCSFVHQLWPASQQRSRGWIWTGAHLSALWGRDMLIALWNLNGWLITGSPDLCLYECSEQPRPSNHNTPLCRCFWSEYYSMPGAQTGPICRKYLAMTTYGTYSTITSQWYPIWVVGLSVSSGYMTHTKC